VFVLGSAGATASMGAQSPTGRSGETALSRYREIIGEVPGYRLRRAEPRTTRPTDEVALLMRDPMAFGGEDGAAPAPSVFRQYDPDGDRPIAAAGDTVLLMHANGRLESALVTHRAYFEVNADAAVEECTIYAPTWFFTVQRNAPVGAPNADTDVVADADAAESFEAAPRNALLIALPARVRRTFPLSERAATAADARLLRGVLDTLSVDRLLGSEGDERAATALGAIRRDLAAGRIPRGLRVATADGPGVAEAERVLVLRLPLPTGNMCDEDYGAEYPPGCADYYVAPIRIVMRGDGRLLGLITAWWNEPVQDVRAMYETAEGERGLVTAGGLASLRAGGMQLRTDGPRVDRLTSDCY